MRSHARPRSRRLILVSLGLNAVTATDTELIRAIKRRDLPEVERLIHAGANLNCSDTQDWTPLFHAAGTGRTDIMRLLLVNGAEVDSHREQGFTPLFSAILSHRLEAIRLLLDAGASPDAPEGDPLLRHVPRDWKHRDEAITLLRRDHATPKA
ncbi:MAG: ankyrin repeat domain-containing protein [Verrucomicrobia bacterium]|nr:MAG: ankyrin repeat domain-containing protein [Verrucomicrobiota bacterium]